MSESTRRLHLNRRRGMLGGVCAGLADYFDIDALLIRIGFVVGFFFWPPIVLVYGLLYFCLNDKPVSGIANSRFCRHFREVDYRKRLYKSRRNKKVAGVCAGLADYFETSPFWIRLTFLLALFFFLGPFAIIAYIVAALVMDYPPRAYETEPATGRAYDRSEELRSRPAEKRDIRETSDKFSDLEKKLRRLEATITSKKFKLHSELNRM